MKFVVLKPSRGVDGMYAGEPSPGRGGRGYERAGILLVDVY